MANFFTHSICNCSCTIPRTKHRLDCTTQLLHRILWELTTGLCLNHLLVCLTQSLQRRCWQVCITLNAGSLLGIIERMLKLCAINAKHDSAVHRNKAAIAVVRKTLVVCGSGQTNHALVIQSQVEHRVHHSRHRKLGARANRYQQRARRIA